MERSVLQEKPAGGYQQGRGAFLARAECAQEIEECSQECGVLEKPIFQEKPRS